MAEFKVGDKVEHPTGGTCTVRYGPYRTRWNPDLYLLEMADGTHFDADDLEVSAPLPAFAVGDKAKMAGETEPVEIIGGPYKNRYRVWFAVKAEVGDATASEGDLTALPAPDPIKAGDRVRVTDDDGAHQFVGRIGRVVKLNSDASRLPYRVQFGDGRGFHGEENGHWNCVAVERVTDTYEYDGVTYDVDAQYRDSDGDVWFFKRMPDGAVRGEYRASTSTYEPHIDNFSETLETAAIMHGPLLKV
ncbi:phiSA1p31-related protein [Streptomyces sp. NPDC088554]|uniref:phiSA1p31-related protein n=1 Tax=Streptomyces sp. NPDC088554 TaxID=3365865 RepID=UPI00380DF365